MFFCLVLSRSWGGKRRSSQFPPSFLPSSVALVTFWRSGMWDDGPGRMKYRLFFPRIFCPFLDGGKLRFTSGTPSHLLTSPSSFLWHRGTLPFIFFSFSSPALLPFFHHPWKKKKEKKKMGIADWLMADFFYHPGQPPWAPHLLSHHQSPIIPSPIFSPNSRFPPYLFSHLLIKKRFNSRLFSPSFDEELNLSFNLSPTHS